MSEIFRHTDEDGDRIAVWEADLRLHMEVKPSEEQSYIGYLHRDAVMRLHAALGEWLYPTGVTLPEKPLTPSDIRGMVAGQVAEIMALHQSPQAGYVDAAPEPHPDPYCTRCLHSWPRHGVPGGCTASRPAESLRPICGCKEVRP